MIIFIIIIYLVCGRFLGFCLYEDIVDDIIFRNSCKYEHDIRPKWFRNILRVFAIVLWPILFIGFIIIMFFVLIKDLLISLIKFFAED